MADKKDDIVLSIRGMSKSFGRNRVLDHINLDVKRGTVMGLMGENGAGKSTLIKLIAGAIEPDEGFIHIGNDSYAKISPKESRAHKIEVIFQEFNLVPTLTVAENILLGDHRGRLADFKEMEQVAKKLLESLGIKINPKKLVRELTPAQQQMVEKGDLPVWVLLIDQPLQPEHLFLPFRLFLDGIVLL